MRTFEFDFNNDGKMDLAILWSRFEPYYGGNYIQLLQNDGAGNFTDVTTSRIDKPIQDAMGGRLQWTNFWQLLDLNGDGSIDIVGQRTGASSAPIVYLNDGTGHFTVTEIPTNGIDVGQVIQWADFDQDGVVELVGFRSTNNAANTTATYQFNVFKLAGDALLPSRTNQIKTGTELDDVLVGTDLNDMLVGKGGNDIINGGAGIDVATFSVARANYTVTKTTNGYTVAAKTSAEGTDTLANIERLKFSDGTLALDISGTAGQAYRLYQAAFARQPDTVGLAHNIKLMDTSLTLKQMSAAFNVSAEFVSLYGQSPTDTQYLTALYSNVLGRDPESAGLNGWLGRLADRSWDRADVLIGFSESPENISLVGVAIQDGIWLG